MRHGSASRRSRNRSNNRRNGNQRNQVFDSNGPDVRIRGTAFQINEKYLALAKDAAGSGDQVMAQSYLQHAEHYQRLINSWDEEEGLSKKPEQQSNTQKNVKEEDLTLPNSILGDEVKLENAEKQLESA